MASYLIRVELHGASADYGALGEAMAKGGARGVVPGSNDTRWQLPSGMYVVEGKPGGAGPLRDVVRVAARAAGSEPEAWVFVAEFTDAAWYGKEVGAG